MMRALYKLLSVLGDLTAASRGPGAYGRRAVRSQAHKALGKAMRRSRWLRL
jgi:hypothetical protein